MRLVDMTFRFMNLRRWQFWENYAHFNPASSIALNVFDVSFPDQREHFLALLILGLLNHEGAHRNLEQFVRSEVLISEMQDCGFLPLTYAA